MGGLMLFKVSSASLYGIEAYLVEVEVDVSLGLPAFTTVGLPDTAIRESKERIRAALRNCGYGFPPRKIVVNLAPADRKKEGSAYDLPISVGILASFDLIPNQNLCRFLFLGELAMDGALKPVKGVLSSAVLAKKLGFDPINKYFHYMYGYLLAWLAHFNLFTVLEHKTRALLSDNETYHLKPNESYSSINSFPLPNQDYFINAQICLVVECIVDEYNLLNESNENNNIKVYRWWNPYEIDPPF